MSQRERGRPGLLVDWGGVMTTDVFTSFAAFCVREELPEDAVRQLFRTDLTARGLLVGLETGELPEEEFERGFAALLGVPPAGLIGRMMRDTRPEPRMLDAVRAARAGGVATGLVSNSWGSGGYPREQFAELFTGVVISGEAKVRKPAREIYELGAEALGLRPDECVFVDDLAHNLKPAQELGMAVVHHTSVDETLNRLSDLLAVDLAPRR
ncbi:HAD family phosphatase [Actinospica sp. MGRD01-02]|uniref:HAD family phosphatase n=1 Tax=Actinospica acidithermotolerans TaxID=2828514 RepID=A0A941E9Z9_9ACTN|nr:HAD family phosphatase [Actinospica acidithermotolerans]MBR7826733.1 HAD family phosphatase [Actinospica acidithermotolerans]